MKHTICVTPKPWSEAEECLACKAAREKKMGVCPQHKRFSFVLPQSFECPAWARKLGVLDLVVWQWVKDLMPYDWDLRQMALEDAGLTPASNKAIVRALRFWDSR